MVRKKRTIVWIARVGKEIKGNFSAKNKKSALKFARRVWGKKVRIEKQFTLITN